MLLRFLSCAIFVVLVAVFSAFGQNGEFEAASSSNLTSVSLPSGAQRVSASHVPAEIEQSLDKLVAQGDGSLRRRGTEVLFWTGGDLKRTGSKTIVNRLTDTLKGAGWKYEPAATENGITFFSLLRDGAERRALIGFHGEADGTLIFACTELEANNAGPANEPVNKNSTPAATSTEGGADPGYQFTTIRPARSS